MSRRRKWILQVARPGIRAVLSYNGGTYLPLRPKETYRELSALDSPGRGSL